MKIANPSESERPGGVWRRPTLRGVQVGATLRHLPTAGFFVVFSAIWNGVTWFMLYGAVTGPLSQALSGGGVGDMLFAVAFLLFLVPFVLIGLVAIGAIALAAFGSMRIEIEPSGATVSVGVGPIRRTRRFDPARVVGIGEDESDVSVDNRARTDIVVTLYEGEFRFGASLRAARRVWVRLNLADALGLGN